MDVMTRIERALAVAVEGTDTGECPPGLAAAMQYAVFPGGARIRPRLCLTVAWACEEDRPVLTDAAASSIELLHCASLIHDDLPCFDDAPFRRGKATVHRAFGEPLAVLAGDALIVLAFETLARAADVKPDRLAGLIGIVAAAVGAPSGIVAGQAWECEPGLELAAYHRAKTGALFAAATLAGAAAAGADPQPWRTLGECIGEAYQVADDLRDAVATPAELGKPTGRDEALGRRSSARDFGVAGSVERLKQLVAEAIDSIPPCARADELKAKILAESRQFLPKELARMAA